MGRLLDGSKRLRKCAGGASGAADAAGLTARASFRSVNAILRWKKGFQQLASYIYLHRQV